jgi:hypothetical protein
MKGFKTRTAGTLLTRFDSPAVTTERMGVVSRSSRLTAAIASGLSTVISNQTLSALTLRVTSSNAPPTIATLATGWPMKNKTIIATATKNRLDDQNPMVTRRNRRNSRKMLADQKLATIDEGDEQRRQDGANGGHRPQRRGESSVEDMREAAEDHILRVAGERRRASSVGGHRDRQQVWDRIALEPSDEIEHEGRPRQIVSSI